MATIQRSFGAKNEKLEARINFILTLPAFFFNSFNYSE